MSDTEKLGGVTKTPMAQLMAQNSDNFLGLALFNQSIIDNYVLLPGEAIEICIAVRAPLASINNVQFLEREVQLLGQVLNASLNRAGLKRRQLVKQR